MGRQRDALQFGLCFDYGNAEIDSRDDDNGTMETTYFGNSANWYHGTAPGPWVMTDQENNLVGCSTPDGSKLCTGLPEVDWRFVTAMAKGQPHHWTTLGGDAQRGDLSVMFDGPRSAVPRSHAQAGAILLGNGGDNSNGSQGTFYEGAMTAGGTFPTDATDRQVQANSWRPIMVRSVCAWRPQRRQRLRPVLQIFAPGTSQETVVTFTNTGGAPVTGVRLHIALPKQWTAVQTSNPEAGPVAPGASVSVRFKITSGAADFNGDLVAAASWIHADGGKQSETAAEKIRNAAPIRINEFRVSSPGNATDAFIELYNAGSRAKDISNWRLTQHQTQQAIFSAVKIPVGTKVAPHGFYLLGLSVRAWSCRRAPATRPCMFAA